MARSDAHTDVSARRYDAEICLVGLGYVGLPLALAFDEAGYPVVGYDVDRRKVERLEDGVSDANGVDDGLVAASDVSFTADASALAAADYVVLAVPTPVDDAGDPDLSFVRAASETVGCHLTRDTTVVLESTVYPGATEDVVVPALEEYSGMDAGEGFHVGYSPERATAGDPEHGLREVTKVVSAFDEETLDDLAALYGSVVDAGVHRVPDVEVAEAAKCVENVQRDLNIALVNELAMAFGHMDIDTDAVLAAAGTKWNFHDYRPGLVGGHCIPVDPLYFLDAAERDGFDPRLVRTGREVNDDVAGYVCDLVRDGLDATGRSLAESRVLALGLTYKPDVRDPRSRPVAELVAELRADARAVAGADPHMDAADIESRFGVGSVDRERAADFDAVVVPTPHASLEAIDLPAFAARMADDPVLVDVQGAFERTAAERAGFVYRTL